MSSRKSIQCFHRDGLTLNMLRLAPPVPVTRPPDIFSRQRTRGVPRPGKNGGEGQAARRRRSRRAGSRGICGRRGMCAVPGWESDNGGIGNPDDWDRCRRFHQWPGMRGTGEGLV